jgi:phosphatidylserine decarboxylase
VAQGDEFTTGRLIGDDELAKAYSHIAIFRLAPQDYHRFHSPVDCTVGKSKDIVGNLYTVNPMAVREYPPPPPTSPSPLTSSPSPSGIDFRNLNVFTQNKRSVRELHTDLSPTPILLVAVGALLVGSIAWTAQEGQKVQKSEDMGYFAYGGSTVIVLFPQDLNVEFDEDISGWSKSGCETILQVGMGVATAHPAAA